MGAGGGVQQYSVSLPNNLWAYNVSFLPPPHTTKNEKFETIRQVDKKAP